MQLKLTKTPEEIPDQQDIPENLLTQTDLASTINEVRETVEVMLGAIETRETTNNGESITVPHSRRVAKIAKAAAKKLSMHISPQAMELYALGHDLGKLAMDEEIIHSAKKVTSEEFERAIVPHPANGISALFTTLSGNTNLDFNTPFFQTFFNVLFFHHQKLDGSGYPPLQEETLFNETQIIADADSFDAKMTRAYHEKMSFEKATTELLNEFLDDPKKYNPKIARAVYESVLENKEIYAEIYAKETEETTLQTEVEPTKIKNVLTEILNTLEQPYPEITQTVYENTIKKEESQKLKNLLATQFWWLMEGDIK